GGNSTNRSKSLDAVNPFKSAMHTIFLDPDTGIMETKESGAGGKRVKKEDVAHLLTGDWDDLDRIVVVYDESFSRHKKGARLKAIQNSMENKLKDLDVDGFAYVGITLNLLFCSTKTTKAKIRLQSIRR